MQWAPAIQSTPADVPSRGAIQTIVKKQVLINVEDKDIRVAVLEDGQLSQLFIEQIDEKSIVGNVYKARVESIVPGLQAVFVNIGEARNAFLHFSDVSSEYGAASKGAPGRSEPGSTPGRGVAKEADGPEGAARKSSATRSKKKRKEIKVGDSILVQASKEPIGAKGARVTSYISIPCRYLVLLPNSEKNGGGVSRRIEDEGERRRLRAILRDLKADEGSFIVRTAGLDHDEGEIRLDVKKSQKLWQRIRRSSAQQTAPSLIYDDHEILGRLVRDELTDDVDEIIIDSKPHARVLRRDLASMMPDVKDRVAVYDDTDQNLFDKYEVEHQFQKALRRKVWLKSGGHIIIDETEAMIAIDVNTGKFVGKDNQEETIFKTNLEAAEAAARQLRLREVGGLIVIDFIDMKDRENQKVLVRHFKDLLKRDRAKTAVGSLSEFGLLQMTRKRVRPSLANVIFGKCPYCKGSGRVLAERHIWKNIKYEMLAALRKTPKPRSLQITVHPDMRRYLENEMLEAARAIANRGRAALNFVENKDYHIEQYDVVSIE